MAENSFLVKIGVVVDDLLRGIDKAVKGVSKLDGSFDNTQKQAKSLSATLSGFERTGDVFGTLTSDTSSFGDKLQIVARYAGQVGDSIKDSFSGGISSIKNLGKSLASSFNAGVVGAKLLKAALISTGIGALVVAVGLLIAYWEDIKGAVNGVSGELQRQRGILDDQVESQSRVLKILDSSNNTLKLQGKSQIAINNLKLKEIASLITIKQQLLENLKVSLEGAVTQEEVYRKLAKKLVALSVLPVLAITKAFDKLAGTDLASEVIKAGQAIQEAITPDLTTDLKDQIVDINLEVVKLTDRLAKLKLQNISLTPRIRPEDIISPNLAQGVTDGLTVAYDAADTVIAERSETLSEKLLEFNNGLADLLSNDAITGYITNIGQGIGDAFANGGNVLAAAGAAMLGVFADILVKYGSLVIAFGIAKEGLAASLKNPFGGGAGAIIAGTLLVAAGSAIKAFSSKLASSGGGGSFSGGASSSSGGGVRSGGFSRTEQGSFSGRVVFEIAGDKLIGVLNNTSLGNLRVGDSDQLITTG